MGFKLLVSGKAVHEFDVDPELVSGIVVEGQNGGNATVPVQFAASEANVYLTLRSENNLEVQEHRDREEQEKAREKKAKDAPNPEALGAPYEVPEEEEEAPAEEKETKVTASTAKKS